MLIFLMQEVITVLCGLISISASLRPVHRRRMPILKFLVRKLPGGIAGRRRPVTLVGPDITELRARVPLQCTTQYCACMLDVPTDRLLTFVQYVLAVVGKLVPQVCEQLMLDAVALWRICLAHVYSIPTRPVSKTKCC